MHVHNLLIALRATIEEYALASQITLATLMGLPANQVRLCFLNPSTYFTLPFLLLLTVPEPVVDEPGCYTDGDCPSKEACFDGECLNPCLHVQPCVQNAECAVKNELPLRVMVCTCKPGYTGKGDERCELISKSSILFPSV